MSTPGPSNSPRPSPAARQTAIEILVAVERGGWSDRLLQARLPALADRRDRALVGAIVLSTLRWQGAIDAQLVALVQGGDLARLQPHVRAALRCGVAQAHCCAVAPWVAVDATVSAIRERGGAPAAGLVNAVLRRALAPAAGGGLAPLDPRASVPAWLWDRWSARWGMQRTLALVLAINRPARPFVVARPDRGGRDAVLSALAAEGVTAEPSARHPQGLVVTGGAPQTTAAFARGDFLLMDEAAALVALLATPPDARPVADLTASPGSKAALVAQHAQGPLVALEVHASRVRALDRTLRARAPSGRTAAVRADATAAPLPSGVFGLVLLDAPCSGTGTLRRRPERRQRVRPADVPACAQLQDRLLAEAARLVGPGGALVYAVCSLEPEEGSVLVARFLAAHPEFRAEDPRVQLGPAAEDLVVGDPPLLVTLPDVADQEGFQAVRMVRRGAL